MSDADILRALRVRYSAPEWAAYTEVDLKGRRADFVAVNLWESRGGHVVGVEIKASRGDWLRELASPSKMERLFRECHMVYLAVEDPKIVKDDLPERWGLLVLQGSRLVQKVKPTLGHPENTGVFWRRLIQHELERRQDMVHSAVYAAKESMRAALEGEEIAQLRKRVAELERFNEQCRGYQDRAEQRLKDLEGALEWLDGLVHFERERAIRAVRYLSKCYWWESDWNGREFARRCKEVADRSMEIGKEIDGLARVIRGEPEGHPEEPA